MIVNDERVGTRINCSHNPLCAPLHKLILRIQPPIKLPNWDFSWLLVLYRQDLRKFFVFHASKRPFWILAILSFVVSSSQESVVTFFHQLPSIASIASPAQKKTGLLTYPGSFSRPIVWRSLGLNAYCERSFLGGCRQAPFERSSVW